MRTEITAREANQHLSRYLDAVENGSEIIITRRGKTVAKLVAANDKAPLSPEQQAAKERILQNLGQANSADISLPTRDEIYGDRF